MTDQDNLRDRMQGVLSEHRQIASGPGDCVCACNRTWVPDAEHRAHVAQAIIDEFELTVEESNDYGDRTERHGILRFGVKTRVVGKWEKQ